MLSVSLSDILLDHIIRRVIFSAFTGGLWLLIAMAILLLFRVKNPAVKHVFYALALSKGFVALVREQMFVQSRGKLSLGIQFPNPFSLIPNFPDFEVFAKGNSTIAFGPGLAVLAAALIFIAWRFSAFVQFQRMISMAPEVDRRVNRRFFTILDRLVETTQVANPRVILIDSDSTPFTVGIKRPIIALAPLMLEQLRDEEIEAVLAHEVAHIARRDHLFHWPIVIMRDVLFFNPLTYFVYRRLSFERERACDDLSAEFCPPLTLAKSLVKIAEIRVAEPNLSVTRAFAPQSLLSKRESDFSRRVTELVKSKPYSPLSRPKRAMFWLSAFIFFYLEIHISALIRGTRLIFS